MRIPLDYYRILGLPIQATADQLKQARSDRASSLPRREYSEVAINARKQLIDEAYTVLSDFDQRKAYDMGFLAKTYDAESELKAQGLDEEDLSVSWNLDKDSDSPRPSIEIEDFQFVGALLIFQELGEYEQLIQLAQPYLSNGSMGIKDGRFGDPELILPDIVLTVALAYLELGREQWQQGQYEKAAASLEAGQDLLLRENLFPSLRGQMQTDLYKLRPYRILELLQRPEEKTSQRHKGLQLFREMLHERGGVDGQGDDQSGLSVEDFLRFVQQLRRHLTSSEQQAIFEVEARRPSAVATYLTVYTLLAQGFAKAQPALVRKAKLMLMQLGRRQDVHLEKAVCALLLGQTEEANRALELSQEREPIAFIREHSKDSPDLLPGLCLYAERWLQDEVFPHFQDLSRQSVSLKDYFANPAVQSYLEALPSEMEGSNEWVVVQPRRATAPAAIQASESSPDTPTITSAGGAAVAGMGADAVGSSMLGQSGTMGRLTERIQSRIASADPASTRETKTPSTTLQTPVVAASTETNPATVSSPELPPNTMNSSTYEGAGNRDQGAGMEMKRPRRTSNQRDFSKILRLILVGAIGLLALWLLFFILSQILGWFARALNLGGSTPRLQGEQAMVQIAQPPLEIPQTATTAPLTGELTPEVADQVINRWLSIKSEALGPNHETEQISQILVNPSLGEWTQLSRTIEADNSYRLYQHSVSIQNVEVDSQNPELATVTAEVREAARFYENGVQIDSKDEQLLIEYQLVRQDNQWQIQEWFVN
ncbi:MAG: IMS domain-containing protein [Microcoleaceae cyanobacterium]